MLEEENLQCITCRVNADISSEILGIDIYDWITFSRPLQLSWDNFGILRGVGKAAYNLYSSMKLLKKVTTRSGLCIIPNLQHYNQKINLRL